MSTYDKASMIRTYDAYAGERDGMGLDSRKRRHVEEAMQVFRENGAESILEIGSGPGSAAQLFLENGFDIECTDISPKMIDLVEQKGIPGHVIDCRDIGRIGKTFDGVFSVNCLLHIPRAEIGEVLVAIRDVMNPDGRFMLGLWGGDDFEGIFEQDRYVPARFFMLYSQRTLFDVLTKVFRIETYQCILFENDQIFHKVVLLKS